MHGAVFAFGRKRESVPVTMFANLGKEKGANRHLALWLNIDGLQKDRAMRKGVPTLAVFLDVFITRHPLEGHPDRGSHEAQIPQQIPNSDVSHKCLHIDSLI